MLDRLETLPSSGLCCRWLQFAWTWVTGLLIVSCLTIMWPN